MRKTQKQRQSKNQLSFGVPDKKESKNLEGGDKPQFVVPQVTTKVDRDSIMEGKAHSSSPNRFRKRQEIKQKLSSKAIMKPPIILDTNMIEEKSFTRPVSGSKSHPATTRNVSRQGKRNLMSDKKSDNQKEPSISARVGRAIVAGDMGIGSRSLQRSLDSDHK